VKSTRSASGTVETGSVDTDLADEAVAEQFLVEIVEPWVLDDEQHVVVVRRGLSAAYELARLQLELFDRLIVPPHQPQAAADRLLRENARLG
jgi:hypothetical protein